MRTPALLFLVALTVAWAEPAFAQEAVPAFGPAALVVLGASMAAGLIYKVRNRRR